MLEFIRRSLGAHAAPRFLPTTARFLPQAGNARAADAVGTPALQGQRMADWAPASAQRVRVVETVAIAAVIPSALAARGVVAAAAATTDRSRRSAD